MKKRLIVCAVLFCLGSAVGAGSAFADSAWWHVTSVSRPSNIQPHAAANAVQQLTVSATSGSYRVKAIFGEGEHVATLEVGESPEEVQRVLDEEIYGSGLEVTAVAGPNNSNEVYRLVFSGSPWEHKFAPTLRVKDATVEGGNQSVTTRQSVEGRPDGELIEDVENVGDALATASIFPVQIRDVLPAGLQASGAIAITPVENVAGSVPCECEVECKRVLCTFSGSESELPEGPEGALGGLPVDHEIEVRIPVEVREGARTCEPHSGGCEENQISVSGGGAPTLTVKHPVTIDPKAPRFVVQDYEMRPETAGGATDTQAGSHPFQTDFTVAFNQAAEGEELVHSRSVVGPVALPKDVRLKLPPGFLGNPSAIPKCTMAQFLTDFEASGDLCPADTAVGAATVTAFVPGPLVGYYVPAVPVFNLEPQVGEPARFGFYLPEAHFGVLIDTAVRTGGDYGVTSTTGNIAETAASVSANVTLWGVPGDPSHDGQRGWSCLDGENVGREPGEILGKFGAPCSPSEAGHPAPFLSLPTSCPVNAEGAPVPMVSSAEADSWVEKGVFASTPGEGLPALDGCNRLQFGPGLRVTPDSQQASRPSGLDVDVHVPQEGQLDGEGLAQSNIKGIEVTLPAGVSLNASAADGLEGCSEQLAGYEGFKEFPTVPGVSFPTFNPYLPGSVDALAAGESASLEPGVNFCPDGSKVATVKIKTPLLPNPVIGAVYLASPQNFHVFPQENPFETHVAMYIVAEDPVSGSLVKLPGKVEVGGAPGVEGLAAGQIRSTFEDQPQLPFEDAEIHFFGGERAPLSTPDHCGTYTTQAVYTPWDGGPQVDSSSSFEVTSGPGGGACPGSTLPFSPELRTGVSNVNAGGLSPLSTTVSRGDGEQQIGSVALRYPNGLSGLIKGVKLCGEAEADAGSCGSESLIGESIVSVGVGGDPFTVTGGRAYLTGPYEGAPYGLSIVNPAKAGPFDLQEGRPVVVRAKVEVNAGTAALSVVTDASGSPFGIPTIIEGFPLEIQHVNVLVNRPGFTFNPANCNPTEITGTVQSAEGASVEVSDPFQVANCSTLKWTPKFTVSTAGHASKADGASLVFKISYPAGAMGTQAWFNEMKFDIPRQLPARDTTLQQACLAGTFEHDRSACPKGSIIGHAVVHSEILPVPLEGPVYFVSYGNVKFPDAVLVLSGYGVTLELHSNTFIDHTTGVTSATLHTLPEVPFESVEVDIPQGPYSEFDTNLPHESRDFCGRKLVMPTFFKASNGLEIHQDTPVEVTGCSSKLSVASHSLHKRTLELSVYAPAAGRVIVTGKGLAKASKTAGGTENIQFAVHTTRFGAFATKVKVTFAPSKGARQSRSLTIHVK
jgi:hypothetical protein